MVIEQMATDPSSWLVPTGWCGLGLATAFAAWEDWRTAHIHNHILWLMLACAAMAGSSDPIASLTGLGAMVVSLCLVEFGAWLYCRVRVVEPALTFEDGDWFALIALATALGYGATLLAVVPLATVLAVGHLWLYHHKPSVPDSCFPRLVLRRPDQPTGLLGSALPMIPYLAVGGGLVAVVGWGLA